MTEEEGKSLADKLLQRVAWCQTSGISSSLFIFPKKEGERLVEVRITVGRDLLDTEGEEDEEEYEE